MLGKLGPGLLFAASAVGVSHLVQSTRAGADFGLTMGVVILGICALKYPAFRFGAEYAAVARESVVAGYARTGKWLLWFFLAAMLVEGLVAIPAVSLVAAGLSVNLLGGGLDENLATAGIVIGVSVALAIGRYRLLEASSRIFVLLFAALTVVATIASLRLVPAADTLFGPFELNAPNLSFAVAVSGWMPVGMGAAVFISLWVLARAELDGRPPDLGTVRLDFHVGYLATVLLALCFLLMGTVLLFGADVELSAGAGAFAAGLVGLFGDALGGWIRPVVSVAALAVMFSTVIAVIDGFPRVVADVLERLFGLDPARQRTRYLACLAIQAAFALVLIGTLFSSFGVFIDFATTAGFVSAPAVAILNHHLMHSAAVAPEARPSRALGALSAVAAAALTLASLGYLYFRFLA